MFIKRNEVVIHATTWMDLENIMLSERKPDTYCMIPFIESVQHGVTLEAESRLLDARGWVEGTTGSGCKWVQDLWGG